MENDSTVKAKKHTAIAIAAPSREQWGGRRERVEELCRRVAGLEVFARVFVVPPAGVEVEGGEICGAEVFAGGGAYLWDKIAEAARVAGAEAVFLFGGVDVFFHAGSVEGMVELMGKCGADVVAADGFVGGTAPVAFSVAALERAADVMRGLPVAPDVARFMSNFNAPGLVRVSYPAPPVLSRPDLRVDDAAIDEFSDCRGMLDDPALSDVFYRRLVDFLDAGVKERVRRDCESVRRLPGRVAGRVADGGKRRVAFLSNVSVIGGAEKYIAQLARNADSEKYEFIFICPGEGELAGFARGIGADVDFAELRPLAAGAAGYMACVSEIGRILVERRADLLHINSIYACQMGAPAGRSAGVPVVCHVHDISVEPRIARDSLLHSCDRVVAVSGAVRDSVVGWGVPEGIVRVEYNGVELDAFRAGGGDAVREELGLGSAPVVVMAGHLYPWKGQRVFLKAAAVVHKARPDVRFLVAGGELFPGRSGGYVEELEGMIADGGLEGVAFMLGRRDDMPAVLGACDVAVHASTRPDPFPFTVIEAMACGLAVIGAAAGGVPEALDGGAAGLLYPPGDADALAGAILRLVNEPVTRKSLGLAARARAERFYDVNVNTMNVQKIYDELLGGDAGD